jgi:hypothetical protein
LRTPDGLGGEVVEAGAGVDEHFTESASLAVRSSFSAPDWDRLVEQDTER